MIISHFFYSLLLVKTNSDNIAWASQPEKTGETCKQAKQVQRITKIEKSNIKE